MNFTDLPAGVCFIAQQIITNHIFTEIGYALQQAITKVPLKAK